MTEVLANRDPSEPPGTTGERDVALVSYLIDVVLLRRPATLPIPTNSPGEHAAVTWKMIGRAMLGTHPGDTDPR